MIVEQGLYAFLTGNVTITNMFGARIYAQIVPQNETFPALTYERVGTRPSPDLDNNPFCTVSFDLTVRGSEYLAVKQIARTVREELRGVTGWLGDVEVAAVHWTNELDVPLTEDLFALNIRGVTLTFEIVTEAV